MMIDSIEPIEPIDSIDSHQSFILGKNFAGDLPSLPAKCRPPFFICKIVRELSFLHSSRGLMRLFASNTL